MRITKLTTFAAYIVLFVACGETEAENLEDTNTENAVEITDSSETDEYSIEKVIDSTDLASGDTIEAIQFINEESGDTFKLSTSAAGNKKLME